MRIVVVGTGYVGLVTGTCFAELGWHVTCVDKDVRKIESLKTGVIPIYEPGLEALVTRNTEKGTLIFSSDLKQAMPEADIVFLAVGTPMNEKDGSADLSYMFAAAREIGDAAVKDLLVVTKSTVPVGTGEKVSAILQEHVAEGIQFEVVSNPEFLREGAAVEDFMLPDRIIVGTHTEQAAETMKKLYGPLAERNVPILSVSVKTAELIKYASNAFVATKIAFINEMADLCEKVEADVEGIARGMGLDDRIGAKYLQPGPGFGGSCFPKDTRALVRTAQQYGMNVSIVDTVVQSNDKRQAAMAERITQKCGGSLEGKTLAILGLTFKAHTDDVRESPSLTIVSDLLRQGASIRAYDPEGMENAKALVSGNISWCDNAYEAAQGADALVIVTEWPEFAEMDMSRIQAALLTPTIIDLRNILTGRSLEDEGFAYYSLGNVA